MDKIKTSIIFAVLVALALVFFIFKKFQESGTTSSPYSVGNQAPCPGETLTLNMDDQYMKGFIEEGAKFKVTINWYACHAIERDDIVFYRISKMMNPVVRMARGIPGDKFKTVPDKNNQGWNIIINDKPVMWEGRIPYFFGASVPPPLSLGEKSRKGVLGPTDVILLSTVPPGHIDSGIFGISNIVDVIGKIELITDQTH